MALKVGKSNKNSVKKNEIEAKAYGFSAVKKSETVGTNAREMEDEFLGMYESGVLGGTLRIVSPPYVPARLEEVVQTNNTLLQCIDAMETNIDGTGYEIELKNSDEKLTEQQKKDIQKLKNFFDEPYPGQSFMTIRKNLRRDLEQVGYGMLEAMRNLKGELVFIRNTEAKMMRLVALDDPVAVEKTIMRDGVLEPFTVMLRERRFVQKMGTTTVFFKEFGSVRELNKKTGEWIKEGQSIDVKDKATEIIYFVAKRDAKTLYGVPRWINQLPSALGSRKAEEYNLDYFDSGGVPPAMIIVQGGSLAEKSSQAIRELLSNQDSKKNRIQVVEAYGSSGSIDSPDRVRVTVERFGSERIQDGMFENYDKRCEDKVRGAFRLPPIFLGRSQEYTYATALASYRVAEAQVFEPERRAFDEIINVTIMKALNADVYKFRSLPVTAKDIDVMLKGLEFVKQDIEGEERVAAVNEMTGLNLKYTKKDIDEIEELKEKNLDATEEEKEKINKNEMIAVTAASLFAKLCQGLPLSKVNGELQIMLSSLPNLDENDLQEFKRCLTAKFFEDPSIDENGLQDLIMSSLSVINAKLYAVQ